MQTRLNQPFGKSPMQRAGNGDEGLCFANWSPAVDIQETDKEYLIKAELPEVKKEESRWSSSTVP